MKEIIEVGIRLAAIVVIIVSVAFCLFYPYFIHKKKATWGSYLFTMIFVVYAFIQSGHALRWW